MMSAQRSLSMDVAEAISELREDFAEGLSTRVAQISDALGAHDQSGRPSAMNLARVRDLSHALAGTAGTYDYKALSDAALDLEQACSRYLELLPEQCVDAPILIKNIYANVVFHAMQAKSGQRSKLTRVEAWSYDFDDDVTQVSRKRVIVVDDDPAMAKILGRQLDYFGYDIEWLSDPDKLDEAILRQKPSAIIMDIIFPGQDDLGIQVISKLKQSGALQCPVIFLSVRSDFASRLAAMRSGCSAYLVKPFGVAELRDTLLNLTNQDQSNPFRVLVIDDDSAVARHNALILLSDGMDVHTVVDATDALFEVRRFNPDVIVMDVHMPRCSGLELAAIIRQESRFIHIPIVFLTADDSSEMSFDALHTGGNEFLNKGIEPLKLISAVRDWGVRNREIKALIDRSNHSEARYRALNQSARDAILTIDESGRIVMWNDAADRMFGFVEDGLLGRPLTNVLDTDLIPSGMRSIARRACVAVRDNGARMPVEFSFATWNVANRAYRTFIIRNASTEVVWANEEDEA